MHTCWSLLSSCFGTIFKFFCFLSHCFSLMFQHQRYPRYYQSNASIAGDEHGPHRSHPSQVKFPNGYLIVGVSPPKGGGLCKIMHSTLQVLIHFRVYLIAVLEYLSPRYIPRFIWAEAACTSIEEDGRIITLTLCFLSSEKTKYSLYKVPLFQL